jgi:hypothetical protein
LALLFGLAPQPAALSHQGGLAVAGFLLLQQGLLVGIGRQEIGQFALQPRL